MPDPLVTRRSALRLLGVATVGLLAGCRSGRQRTSPTPPSTPTAGSPQPTSTSPPAATPTEMPAPTPAQLSPDQLLAQRVARAEQSLLAAYDAATLAHPDLAGRLAPFRADHAAHLHGLVPGATATSTPPSSTPPSSTPPSSTPPSSTASPNAPLSSPPPATPVFQQLADLERNAAAARVDDVVMTSGSLARLLASIGGCEAAHTALLLVAT